MGTHRLPTCIVRNYNRFVFRQALVRVRTRSLSFWPIGLWSMVALPLPTMTLPVSTQRRCNTLLSKSPSPQLHRWRDVWFTRMISFVLFCGYRFSRVPSHVRGGRIICLSFNHAASKTCRISWTSTTGRIPSSLTSRCSRIADHRRS